MVLFLFLIFSLTCGIELCNGLLERPSGPAVDFVKEKHNWNSYPPAARKLITVIDCPLFVVSALRTLLNMINAGHLQLFLI
jgi:hypothetical protein